MTAWKKGDLAYFVRELDPDSDNPFIASIAIAQASDKQVTLAARGPDGALRFGLIDEQPKLHRNGRVKLFRTPHAALVEYHEIANLDVGFKRRALATAERRAAWAGDQLVALLDELREQANLRELAKRKHGRIS